MAGHKAGKKSRNRSRCLKYALHLLQHNTPPPPQKGAIIYIIFKMRGINTFFYIRDQIFIHSLLSFLKEIADVLVRIQYVFQ
jgi:hypothetical protein